MRICIIDPGGSLHEKIKEIMLELVNLEYTRGDEMCFGAVLL